MDLLKGKKALIVGIANDHSIAWGIAQALKQAGAELAFSYAGESLERRVRPLAEQLGVSFVQQCDVSDDAQIATLFERLGAEFGSFDILVHSVAYAKREDLSGRFVDSSRDGWRSCGPAGPSGPATARTRRAP